MAVVFDSGFAVMGFAFINGKNQRVVAKAGLVGGAPTAVDPLASTAIKDLLTVNNSGAVTQDFRVYNKTDFDAWEAGGFIVGNEPTYDIFDRNFVYA